jgi:pimeloyl-ACP methyl ester carboxylesterase
VVRDVARAATMASTVNHSILTPPAPSRHRLGEITAPTLVLHGTEDPLFPYGHGQALAKEIPGAALLPLDQTGHELPARTWDTVLAALTRHTSA